MSQLQNSELFEKMPVPKAVGKLMVPTILSSLVMVVYSMADTYFVGLLNNSVQNAAVTLASPALLAFNAINNLFGVGSSSMMSRSLGSKDYDTVRKSAAFGFYCSLGCSLILSLLCLTFLDPLLVLLGANSLTLKATAGYMEWAVICGAAPSILNVVMAYLVRAEGAALHASIGTMSGCLLNIILDPIFIMPWGLNIGAAGAGCATFISNCVAFTYFMILLFFKRGRTFISINPKNFCLHKNIVVGICSVGIPAAIQNILNVTGMTILNNFTAAYGAEAVAAMGIAQKIYMVPVQIAMGATQGVMPLISYSYSSKNHKRMNNVISFVTRLLLPSMFTIALLCWLFAGGLIHMFMKNPDIIHYGTMFLHGFCLAMPFLVVDFMVVGVFQGIGNGRQSLIFAILRKIVFEIPATFLLNTIFHAAGLGYGAFIAELLLSAIGVKVLLRILRQYEAQN